MLCNAAYSPSLFLQNGVRMTIYAALWGKYFWEATTDCPEPPYKDQIFICAQQVPLYGQVAIPNNPRGTIIATYGVTGDLETEWLLKFLRRKAYAAGYAVILFDWRSRGKSAQLSPTIPSGGLYEGEDFIRIAATAAKIGCPKKFWFFGYSLGGQLALWGLNTLHQIPQLEELGITRDDIAGAAVICPSLDSVRSLPYLCGYPVGRFFESRITQKLKQITWKFYHLYPKDIDPEAIKRANSIWSFDEELVISKLGFGSVEEYYKATRVLNFLPKIDKPTLIIYAEDDPFFNPSIVPDLKSICSDHRYVDLLLTKYGGHVGYLNSYLNQLQNNEPDPWWAINRILEWLEIQDSSSG
ncbi:MAG: alpha/beta fold hydrolase [Cyanobacteria bacterium P01_A01_bin.45]